MSETASDGKTDTLRLIFVPALISLAVTLLRLTGELRHWSERWFSTETGGIVPTGLSWVVGISWLAAPFGIYFAWKLAAAGNPPRSIGKALLRGATGLVILFGAVSLVRLIPVGFPRILLFIWFFCALAAAVQYFAWPELFRVLLAYGLVARIPVAVVMFFAMRGNWGTHYDYVGMPPQFMMDPLPRYLWLAFFPQLIFWVAFTAFLGSIAGVIAMVAVRPKPASGTDIG